MSRKKVLDKGRSVYQRLLDLARTEQLDFNGVLTRYGIERFLFRLGNSRHRDDFVLKGGTLFIVWIGQNHRVTRDADFLGFGPPDVSRIEAIFRELCSLESYEHDGMVFLGDTVEANEIRDNQEYDGIRVRFKGKLTTAVVNLQIDIGFGDVVFPEAETIEFPVLLDAPKPLLSAYSVYTLIAEKTEAMIRFGLLNSRLKDFYDIWLISNRFELAGHILLKSIMSTLQRRRTDLPDGVPSALTAEFGTDQSVQTQWKAFLRRACPVEYLDSFAETIERIADFLVPVLKALQSGISFQSKWIPKEGWTVNEKSDTE